MKKAERAFKSDLIKDYYLLTKPGIIRGNVYTAIGGFLLASQGTIDWWLFVAVTVGVVLIIASACVFNNYVDRHIDSKMSRTKSRALAAGRVSHKAALTYATLLGIGGFIALSFTNLVTITLGLLGIFSYVVVYGAAKRRTVYGTLVGTVPGATSITAGYTAVTGGIDQVAVLLFLILVFWQMPHFYAIAIMGIKDYEAAGIPVMPIKKGLLRTKLEMLVYTVAFVVATILLAVLGYVGWVYGILITLLGLGWIIVALRGFKTKRDSKWALDMFKYSLRILSVFSVLIAVDVWLP